MIGASLADAVERSVRPGDCVQVICGHSRWTALAREMVRQLWRSDAGLTLVMTSLSSLGALFFEGGLVSKVITAYSGDTFPTYSPNPIFRRAYESGAVEVEHWSILTLAQRLEAGARGLPAMVTGSIGGSSMASNASFCEMDTPFGHVGLLAPLAPDIALVHAAVSDREGNLVCPEPMLEGMWGAWAARRGVVASVESIVESVDGLGYRVRIPAHRVLDVVEAPFGAHPGGCYAPGLPCRSYGEDIGFFSQAAAAARGDFAGFADRWVLGARTQEAYLDLFGDDHLRWLEGRSDPSSWMQDSDAHPRNDVIPPSDWEIAAALAAREVQSTVARYGADAVLAGAGVANLAAWVAVGRMREEGRAVALTAELGLWGYTPTPADPYIFNHRVFPSTTQLSDASTVLGMVIGGPGSRVVGCLGAAQVDGTGNINSTQTAAGRFLVGSGGANDVASRAAACVVVTLAHPERVVDVVDYITAPGRNVTSIVTDRGVLRREDGVMRMSAVAPGPGSLDERVRTFAGSLGCTLEVSKEVEALLTVTSAEVSALREYDRERLFLR